MWQCVYLFDRLLFCNYSWCCSHCLVREVVRNAPATVDSEFIVQCCSYTVSNSSLLPPSSLPPPSSFFPLPSSLLPPPSYVLFSFCSQQNPFTSTQLGLVTSLCVSWSLWCTSGVFSDKTAGPCCMTTAGSTDSRILTSTGVRNASSSYPILASPLLLPPLFVPYTAKFPDTVLF